MKDKEPPLHFQLSELIKDVRIENGLTQREFAKKVGVAEILISMVETGRRKPSVNLFEKVAKTFNKRVKVELLKELTKTNK